MYTADELYGQPWGSREYMLVLAKYIENRGRLYSADDEDVVELSDLLGRTPASIVMRMENFAGLDPENRRRGLAHVSPICREVFDEWNVRPEDLKAIAEFITGELRVPKQFNLFGTSRISLPISFRGFELLDLIGQGGFGEVYSCIKKDSGELFAIKILRADRASNPEALSRFAREMRALRSVRCPHIINLHEDNLASERQYPAFIMDLGVHSLTSYAVQYGICQSGSSGRPLLPPGTAILIMNAMLAATIALHSNVPKIIHRDINPNNIIQLPNGRWVLADFGLAKFLGPPIASSKFSTHTQQGWATTYFAPPEQHQYFKNTDERADIFALGVLLWELFSPSWPAPQIEKSGLPGSLDSIFRRAANPEYDDRYHSVEEMAKHFDSVATDLG